MVEPIRTRQEAKRETREALIDAGLAEFSLRGLAEPSLDAICARAGFTRGAFYVHFRDRDDFISAVMERVLGAFLDAVIATGDEESDLEQTVRRFADVLVGAAGDLPGFGGRAADDAGRLQFHRVLEAGARSDEIKGRLGALLEDAIERVSQAAAQGQASGSVHRDVDPQAVGALLVVLALGAVNAVEVGVRFDTSLARDALLTLLRGQS